MILYISLLAGLIENIDLNVVETSEDKLFHVCATSYSVDKFKVSNSTELYIINSHYFHLRVLEKNGSNYILDVFKHLVMKYKSANNLKNTSRIFKI